MSQTPPEGGIAAMVINRVGFNIVWWIAELKHCTVNDISQNSRHLICIHWELRDHTNYFSRRFLYLIHLRRGRNKLYTCFLFVDGKTCSFFLVHLTAWASMWCPWSEDVCACLTQLEDIRNHEHRPEKISVNRKVKYNEGC